MPNGATAKPRSFFRQLAEIGQGQDPFTAWRPKLPRRMRLPRALARSESVTLAKSLNDTGASVDLDRHVKAALRLLVATGLRVGELCGLQLGDVSPDCTVVRVHGKGSKDRVAYVTDPILREALKSLVAARRLTAGGDGPLLITRSGGPMKPQSVYSPVLPKRTARRKHLPNGRLRNITARNVPVGQQPQTQYLAILGGM